MSMVEPLVYRTMASAFVVFWIRRRLRKPPLRETDLPDSQWRWVVAKPQNSDNAEIEAKDEEA